MTDIRCGGFSYQTEKLVSCIMTSEVGPWLALLFHSSTALPRVYLQAISIFVLFMPLRFILLFRTIIYRDLNLRAIGSRRWVSTRSEQR